MLFPFLKEAFIVPQWMTWGLYVKVLVFPYVIHPFCSPCQSFWCKYRHACQCKHLDFPISLMTIIVMSMEKNGQSHWLYILTVQVSLYDDLDSRYWSTTSAYGTQIYRWNAGKCLEKWTWKNETQLPILRQTTCRVSDAVQGKRADAVIKIILVIFFVSL